MFLGGVDQLVAETRPASLKGILRYWYRILITNKYASQYELKGSQDWMDYKKWANKNLWQKVYEDEGELFGTQDKAGKVWIRMGKITRKLSASEVRKWLGSLGRELSYIGYGPILYVNPNNPKYRNLSGLYGRSRGFGPVRGYFSPDIRFTEPLTVVREWSVDFLIKDETIRDRIMGLLWFVSMFGSLGSRSRKGWGSFYLDPIDEKYGFKSWSYSDPQTFKGDFQRASDLLGISISNLEIYYVKNILDLTDLNEKYRRYMYPYSNPRRPRPLDERNYFGLPRKNIKKIRRASPVHFKPLDKGLLIIRKLEPFIDPSQRVPLNPNAFNLFLNSLGNNNYQRIWP